MKVMRLIISIALLIFTACTSIKSSEEISLDRVEGSKLFKVNYDKRRYNTVKLNDIVIDSGRTYYVKKGRYVLSYNELTFLEGYVDFSWKKERRNSNSKDRKIPTRRVIDIVDDTVIDLKNHRAKIGISGTLNSNKNF